MGWQLAGAADVELPRKVLAVDVLHEVVARYTSIVDDDIQLEFSSLGVRKIVLGHLHQVLGPVLRTHAGLHCQCLDPILGRQFGRKVFGGLGRGVGGVVDDYVAAFTG
jgi:hypothetical protein